MIYCNLKTKSVENLPTRVKVESVDQSIEALSLVILTKQLFSHHLCFVGYFPLLIFSQDQSVTDTCFPLQKSNVKHSQCSIEQCFLL